MIRKQPLVTGQVYHVMNKSIAGYRIFNSASDHERIRRMMMYFVLSGMKTKFSQFFDLKGVRNRGFEEYLTDLAGGRSHIVQIVAYCIMPTHLHLVLKQLADSGVSKFMSDILNGYTRYFNTKHSRRGPLWVGKFKNVLVENDEQLLHLTRYIHLNPATSDLVEKPEDWKHSSYNEYVLPEGVPYPLCNFREFIHLGPKEYRDFVLDQVSYQRELAVIKKIALE